MKKPVPKIKKVLYYNECEKYIAEKLGIKDLRNVAGKTYDGSAADNAKKYLDFWHFLCDSNDVHNGCEIMMPYCEEDAIYEDKDKWALDIARAFAAEFGPDAEYWVAW